jgi:hypothetical protein
VMEMLFTRQLREVGEVLIADDRLVVSHVQSHGFWGTLGAHFHYGRSIAGFRLEHLAGIGRILRLGSTAILPPYLLWSTLLALLNKQRFLGKSLRVCPCSFFWSVAMRQGNSWATLPDLAGVPNGWLS